MTQFFDEPRKKGSSVHIVGGLSAALPFTQSLLMADAVPYLVIGGMNNQVSCIVPDYNYKRGVKSDVTIHDLHRMNAAEFKRRKRKARNVRENPCCGIMRNKSTATKYVKIGYSKRTLNYDRK